MGGCLRAPGCCRGSAHAARTLNSTGASFFINTITLQYWQFTFIYTHSPAERKAVIIIHIRQWPGHRGKISASCFYSLLAQMRFIQRFILCAEPRHRPRRKHTPDKSRVANSIGVCALTQIRFILTKIAQQNFQNNFVLLFSSLQERSCKIYAKLATDLFKFHVQNLN